MIREERDPAWWQAIADHPRVAPTIYLQGRFGFDFVRLAEVTPLAMRHGGFLFHRVGGAHELHALFTPEGWGRQVARGLKRATEHMVALGATRFIASEVLRQPNSRPPLSHGWRVAGPFAPGVANLTIRPWTLSVSDWRASPAFRRMA